MNWVAIIWAASSGVCLMLGIMQLFLWLKSRRPAREYLSLAFTAFAVAGIALAEWLMMTSREPEEYARVLRWAHVPAMVMLVGIVAFVRFHFRVGITWLAWTVIGMRIILLVLNFIIPENLNFREITALKQMDFLGQQVSVIATAVSNPFTRIAELSEVLLLWYVVDASLKLWRRGDPEAKRKALLVGGGIVGFLLIAAIHASLVQQQIIESPYIISFAFFCIILPMAHELSHDVLATVRLSEDLRQAQQQMTLAASAAKLALWTWDIPGNHIWVTDEGRSMYGVPEETEITVERFLETIHPEDRDDLQRAMMESVGGGSRFAHDYRVRLPDGQVRWISARARVEFDKAGRPLVMRGVSMDNSERRQAEERAQLVVEAAPNAMIMVDAEANVMLVNKQAEITFGYKREEMLGRPIEMLVPHRFSAGHPSLHRGYFDEPQRRAMGTGRDLFGRRKDGTEVPVEVGLNPIHTSEGRFVLASVIDISERRRAEQEATEQRNELFHLSRVTSLGQLSGSLAHELNQPLGIILSNAQAAQRMLMEQEPDLEELRAILSDIVEEDRRAGSVITRLRALLKRGETQLLPVSAKEVVEDVVQLLRSDFVSRGVTVQTVFTEGLPKVAGDQVQLQQVLLNLIINGCDAMAECPPQARKLRISTGLEGDKVRVSVEDQGSGVPERDLSRIFQPFFTTKPQGMGIGLAICRTIMVAHHGRLWAEPNEGRGTTFHLELQAIDPAVG